MALFDPSELRQWRYVVTSCIVVMNGQATSVDPKNVVGMEIENNYLTEIFPIFKLNLNLDELTYYKFLENKTKLKLYLRVQKYSMDYSGGHKSGRQDFINGNFTVIDDENDKNREVDWILIQRTRQASSVRAMQNTHGTLELYLYREEVASGIKIQINDILTNTTLSSAIGYLFSTAGIKNALVSPLENNQNYKILPLPPLTINKSIMHLDAMYGFYKYGSVVFFGIDRTYILNFKGGCTAFERGEKKEVCVFIPKKSKDDSVGGGGSIDRRDDKFYLNWPYDFVNFKNASVSGDVLSGSDALVVNQTDASQSKSASKTMVNGTANTAIIDNKGENKWIGTTFTAQTSSGSLVLTGNIKDIDLSALTPNKKFSLIFEDSTVVNQYKGTYFLGGTAIKFVNDTGSGDFSVSVDIEFRRLQNTTSTSKSIK